MQFRTLCWAAAGSIIYGLSTALMKVGWTMFNAGSWAHPYFWITLLGIGVCYLVGMLLIQQAHAVGAPEIVVGGAMTVADPLTAVTFGIAVLGGGGAPGCGLGHRHGRDGGAGRFWCLPVVQISSRCTPVRGRRAAQRG